VEKEVRCKKKEVRGKKEVREKRKKGGGKKK